jgi:lipid II:glycine glycyltransferase (peptidoglycan interpeptide bridge formation enzyme)
VSSIIWDDSVASGAWDRGMAMLSAHPLQTALWGDSRESVDGISQIRLQKMGQDNSVLAMARVEIRKIPFLGRIAWIPRGPAVAYGHDRTSIIVSLQQELKARGFLIAVIQPWHEVTDSDTAGKMPRTIWIDLTVGEERLFKNLDPQWRYGVRRASREGVAVELSSSTEDVNAFFQLCTQISQTKGFQLPGSASLIARLIQSTAENSEVEAKFFVARCGGKLGAGAIVMRCGENAHYLWGGVDREYSGLRTGEAVQWAVIQWALSRGCKVYDLEGIDPTNNLGTYKFKKKMGGRQVTLPSMSASSLRAYAWPLKKLIDCQVG